MCCLQDHTVYRVTTPEAVFEAWLFQLRSWACAWIEVELRARFGGKVACYAFTG